MDYRADAGREIKIGKAFDKAKLRITRGYGLWINSNHLLLFDTANPNYPVLIKIFENINVISILV